MSTEKRLVREVTRRLYPYREEGDLIGCHDGSCVFGHPGGMHTNSMCGCAYNDSAMTTRNLRRLSSVARELAREVIELRAKLGGER